MTSWALRKFRNFNQSTEASTLPPSTMVEDVATSGMAMPYSPSQSQSAVHLNAANDHLRDHRGHKTDQAAYAYQAGAHMATGDEALSASYQRLADLHGQLADAHLDTHTSHRDRYLDQINNAGGTDGPAK